MAEKKANARDAANTPKETTNPVNEEPSAEAVEAAILPDADKTEPGEFNKISEITIKFGKGCLGDPFTGKDGNEYRSVLIPNADSEDHRPWASFVVRANRVHEDKFGKGMWTKVLAEGYTTIRRSVKVGKDEAGKDIWENEFKKVTNKELKSMVEFYKERPRESVKEKLVQKQAEVATTKEKMPKPEKAKANFQEAAI